jgi:hypothetical protein
LVTQSREGGKCDKLLPFISSKQPAATVALFAIHKYLHPVIEAWRMAEKSIAKLSSSWQLKLKFNWVIFINTLPPASQSRPGICSKQLQIIPFLYFAPISRQC